MEFKVAGKKVIVRDRMSLSDGFDLYGLMLSQDSKDLRTQVPLLVKMVESWEFEGDPHVPDTYLKLDIFREFMPISRKVLPYVRDLLVAGVSDEAEQETLKN